MSGHDAEKRRPAERCHRSCFLCWRLRPSRLTSSEGKRKPAAGPTRLFAGLFSAAVMWGGIISIGSCHRDIASRPRLRFSPLEIFAPRQFQPIPPWIFHRFSVLALEFILPILLPD